MESDLFLLFNQIIEPAEKITIIPKATGTANSHLIDLNADENLCEAEGIGRSSMVNMRVSPFLILREKTERFVKHLMRL